MALSNLHTNWIKGSYTADRDEEIKNQENAKLLGGNLAWLNAHADTVGNSIAVGYGYDLKKNLSTLKTDLAGYVTASTDLNKVYDLVNEYFNQGNPKGFKTLDELATAINAYFDFGTETKASDLLAATVSKFETLLDTYLGYSMPQSKERAALVDLAYNAGKSMFKVTVNGIEQDSKLTKAIKNDNRAEAWFEMRYNSNGGNSRSQGIANRRYSESDMFDLFDDGPLTVEGTKEVFRMFTKHQSEINAYESAYPSPSSSAIALYTQVQQAKEYLVNQFGQGKSIDEVIVGAGLQSYEYQETWSIDKIEGTDKNELIFGEKGSDILDGGAGDDVIYGGEGNDRITGGQGDDYLEGGAGNDTYYINTGDGTDTIEDKEGNNRVIVNGKEIGLLIKQDDGSYKNPDGKIRAAIEGTDLVLYDAVTGAKLAILNENFQDGDFGIHLLDAPSDPVTTNTIIGDEQPIGTIYDTSANDRIIGTSGDDDIIGGWHGGSDWILGGDGSDAISTLSGIVEGNAGADIIMGGPDDSKLFGENYGEMEQLIADGEIAPGIATKGDLVLGNDGNDQISGSNANDALFGGDGHDLLVGGGGDDAIFGDDHAHGAERTWSFSITQGVGVDLNGVIYEQGTFKGDDTIYAGTGNDFVYAGGGGDEVYAGDGDDTVIGERGDDFIDGGEGNDILQGDASWVPVAEQGSDYIDGGSGNDKIWGNAGSDDLFGGSGNDEIYGDNTDDIGAGDDYLDGEDGDDKLIGNGGSDAIFGGEGNDYIEGDNGIRGSGNDYLDGEGGNDTLLGNAGNDELFGGAGDDWLQGDDGDDYLDGEAGVDILLGANGNDQIYGGDGNDHLQGDAGNDILDGEAGEDVLVGIDGDDEIYGGEGNDRIWGGIGADVISGGGGNDTIYGEAGDNTIYGGEGADQIYGGVDNDYIEGGAGTDIILGGSGNDQMYGGDDNDQLQGDAGNDILDGGAGDDVLLGVDGDDEIYGGDGSDYIEGSEGSDYIDGGAGGDTMYGGNGDDTYVVDNSFDQVTEYSYQGIDTVQSSIAYTLGSNIENLTLVGSENINGNGNSMSNALVGNSGNNILQGDAGNDTYKFGIGSGADTIYNYADDHAATTDTVEFGAGITAADIELIKESSNLRINIKGTPDSLIIKNWFSGGEYKVDQFKFADNTVLTAVQLEAMGYETTNTIRGTENDDFLEGSNSDEEIFGYEGNDTIIGNDGNDMLIGGKGNDMLYGGAGDDTYIYNVGDGIDGIDDTATANEGNTLVFGEGITPDSLSLSLGSLLIKTGNEGDEIHIDNFNPDDAYGAHAIETFQFADGTTLSYNQLIDKGFDLTGTSGDDVINGTNAVDRITTFEGNDAISSGVGNDVIDGGIGNDVLNGGTGDDTYIYNLGDGLDQINDESGMDTLQMGEGIDFDHTIIRMEQGVAHLRLLDQQGNQTLEGIDITLNTDGTIPLEKIAFADGTVINASELIVAATSGTRKSDVIRTGRNDDTIYASNGNDMVYAGLSNDTVYGENGNDALYGEGGNDTLYGENGYDLLEGGNGKDILYGGNGDDVLIGGKGNDMLYGERGSDTYVFNHGDGEDTISEGGGDADTVQFEMNPLELIFSKSGSDLEIAVNGTADKATVQNWYSGSAYQTEVFQASDGSRLLNTKVEQLIQAMATFGADNGMSWSDAIQQKPQEVQAVLAQYWEKQ